MEIMISLVTGGLFLVTLFLDFPSLAVSDNGIDLTARLRRNGDVIIGGLFPVHLLYNATSCSELRPSVLIWTEAFVYAIDEINSDARLLENVTLGYDIRDTFGSDQQGVAVAADYVYQNTLKFDRYFTFASSCNVSSQDSDFSREQAPIIAVIGGVDSRVSVNVANVLQLVDIPQISYGATSDELASSDFTSFFRTVPLDHFQSQAMAELVAHFGGTCVSVIGVDDWYGRSGVDAFMNAANKTGICVVSHDLFPVYDSEDRIYQMIAQLKQLDHVEILILYCLAPQAITVFEEAVRQQLTGKTWIASDGWYDSSLIQQQRFMPIIQGTIGFGFHKLQFPEFQTHVTTLTPLLRHGLWWTEFWKSVLSCSVNSSDLRGCTSQDTISPELYERQFNDGLAPYVRDAVYAVAHGLDALLRRCKEENLQCSNVSSTRPEDLLASLKQLAFKGLTGPLNFSNSETQAAYDIFNLRQTNESGYELVQIGSWNATGSQRLTINDERIQWHNNKRPSFSCGELCPAGTYRSVPNQCQWECVPCDEDTISQHTESTECVRCSEGFISNSDNTHCDEVPVEYIKWQEPWGVTLSVFTAVCILLTLVILGVVIYKYKTPIIQDTGPQLNVLLLIVITFSYVFNIIHLNKPSDLWCQVLPPTFYLIYASAVAVQFMKVYRIRSLVRPAIPETAYSAKSVYLIAACVGITPFVLSMIWVLTDPPHAEKYIVSRLIVYSVCKQYETTLGLVIRYFCAFLLSILVIVGVITAYNTKQLPHSQRLEEAKHLAFSMTLFVITLATFYPGWLLIRGPILTVFASTTNMVAATGTTLCVYVPKLWIIYRFPRCNTTKYVRPAPPETRAERGTTLMAIGTSVNAVVLGMNDSPKCSNHS